MSKNYAFKFFIGMSLILTHNLGRGWLAFYLQEWLALPWNVALVVVGFSLTGLTLIYLIKIGEKDLLSFKSLRWWKLVLTLLGVWIFFQLYARLPIMTSNENQIELEISLAFMDDTIFFLMAEIIILGPLLEEFIYRGILMGHFLKKLPYQLDLILTSIWFTLPHVILHQNWQWQEFLPYLIAGLTLGLVFKLSKSIWYACLFHIGISCLASPEFFIFLWRLYFP